MKTGFNILGGVFVVLGYIGLILSHFLCCYIAYTIGPFWKVIATFTLPILSEAYWIIYLWDTAGGMPLLAVIIFIFLGSVILGVGLKTAADKMPIKTVEEKGE